MPRNVMRGTRSRRLPAAERDRRSFFARPGSGSVDGNPVGPEHTHGAQTGVVLEVRIDLVIGGDKRTYRKGDRYCIPRGVWPSGKVYAGYAQTASFDEPDRYRPVAPAVPGKRASSDVG